MRAGRRGRVRDQGRRAAGGHGVGVLPSPRRLGGDGPRPGRARAEDPGGRHAVRQPVRHADAVRPDARARRGGRRPRGDGGAGRGHGGRVRGRRERVGRAVHAGGQGRGRVRAADHGRRTGGKDVRLEARGAPGLRLDGPGSARNLRRPVLDGRAGRCRRAGADRLLRAPQVTRFDFRLFQLSLFSLSNSVDDTQGSNKILGLRSGGPQVVNGLFVADIAWPTLP